MPVKQTPASPKKSRAPRIQVTSGASSRLSHYKAGALGGRARKRRTEQREASASCDAYPPAMLEAFKVAMKKSPSVSVNADIMDGQPCIAGTRIPVRAVLRVIEHYGSLDEAIRCYPHLTKDQVKDALYFSQALLELPNGIDETPIAS